MCRRLLCYGDSNTYGYDPRSYLGGRYPESVRWTALLKGYGWEDINRGENGRSIPRSGRETDMAVQSLCREEADILTVMLGSNDLLQMPSPSAQECADRMERFLTACSMRMAGINPAGFFWSPRRLWYWVLGFRMRKPSPLPAVWRNAVRTPHDGWISALPMRAVGGSDSRLTGCIFPRRGT